MITEAILNVFFNLIYKLLDLIPLMNFEFSVGSIDAFMTALDMSAYFLPMGTILALIGILIVEELLKIYLSLIKLVLKFIPFMG